MEVAPAHTRNKFAPRVVDIDAVNSPIILPIRFPTALHREVADVVRSFFSAHERVDTILVVNSCARDRAVAGSDLDMAVLVAPTVPIEEIQSLTMKYKWIREQVIEWLSLPELYEELPQILSVRSIESAEIGQKGDALRVLLERWTCLGGGDAVQLGWADAGKRPVKGTRVATKGDLVR